MPHLEEVQYWTELIQAAIAGLEQDRPGNHARAGTFPLDHELREVAYPFWNMYVQRHGERREFVGSGTTPPTSIPPVAG